MEQALMCLILKKKNLYKIWVLLFMQLFLLHHSQEDLKLNAASQIWLSKIDSCLQIKAGDKIADIGSGNLYNLSLIASRHADAHFYACDIMWHYRFSKKRVIKKLCRRYGLPNHHNISCSPAKLKGSRFASSQFNKVLLLNTFHDLAYINLVMNDIKRILKKDGELIIEECFHEKESTFKFGTCYRPFFTEAYFKQLLAQLHVRILSEAIVYTAKPEDRYYLRKQFKCQFE